MDEKSSPASGRRLILVIGALFGLLSLIVWFGGMKSKTVEVLANPEEASIPASVRERLHEGHDAQLNSDWYRALAIFQELHNEFASNPPASKMLIEDVERNLHMLRSLCPDTPAPSEETQVPQKKRLPEKLPEDVLIERYPVGKTLRSIGYFTISGKGRNTAWGIRGSASFTYRSEVSVETRVVECDTKFGRLIFEQSFGDVTQICAVSNQSLELVIPDSLPLKTFWPPADGQLRRLSPHYRVFRRITEIVNFVDPGLRRTLTAFSDALRRGGVKLNSADEVEFFVQAERLSGAKFRIVYLSGLGVTSISQLDEEPKLGRDDLIRLAHASTVMVDYCVFPSLKRHVGETWEVRADDVGSLIALYDPTAELSGTLKLTREKDEEPGKISRFRLVGGTVEANSNVDGIAREGRMGVRNGFALFDLVEYYVRRAQIGFTVHSLHQSRDHLLFGTEQLRDLNVESRYEAEGVKNIEIDEPEK